PRGAGAQALVATACGGCRGTAASGDRPARARCRRRPPAVLDLARRVAPSPLVARRLRLSPERREIDLGLASEDEIGGGLRDRGRELETVAREPRAHDRAVVDAIDDGGLGGCECIA